MMRSGSRPVLLGLTGGIAMGKSEAGRAFRRLGVPVFDADAIVHRLLAAGGAAVKPVAKAFPTAVCDGCLDRRRLGTLVFGDDQALRRLESILHPLVASERDRFIRRTAALGARVVVLDVPLLFETGGEKACDYVAVVSAPPFVQRRRALRRAGMTAEKLEAILAHQTRDADKRRRADFVIPTGLGRREGLQAIRRILRMLTAPRGQKGKKGICVRSCSTPRPPGSTRRRGIASSRSAVSRW
jgi:dephospho-CoA kinase